MDAQETLRLARKRLECVTTGLECVGATRQPGTTGHKDVAYVQHHAADLGRLLDQLAGQLTGGDRYEDMTPEAARAAGADEAAVQAAEARSTRYKQPAPPAERNGKPHFHAAGCPCLICEADRVAAKIAADRKAAAAGGCGVPGCPTCAAKAQLAEEVSVTAILFGRPGPTAARHDRGFTKPADVGVTDRAG